MDTSDEEDVCMGPISLNDIRKALGVMENYNKKDKPVTSVTGATKMSSRFGEDDLHNNLFGNKSSEVLLLTKQDSTEDLNLVRESLPGNFGEKVDEDLNEGVRKSLLGLSIENPANFNHIDSSLEEINEDLNAVRKSLLNSSKENIEIFDLEDSSEKCDDDHRNVVRKSLLNLSVENTENFGSEKVDENSVKKSLLNLSIENTHEVISINSSSDSIDEDAKSIAEADSFNNSRDSDVVLLEESTDSFILCKDIPAPKDESKQKPDLCSTKHWNGLVNNLSDKFNIFDQTAPEYLHQTAIDDTIVPKIRVKSNAFNLTGFGILEMQDESLANFEELERMVQSPLKASPQKKPQMPVIVDGGSSDSCATSIYETAQQSSADSFDFQSARDVTNQNSSDDTNHSIDLSDGQDLLGENILDSFLDSTTLHDLTDHMGNNSHQKLGGAVSVASPSVVTDYPNDSLEFDNTFDEMQYLMKLNTKPVTPSTPINNKSINKTLTPKAPASNPYPKFSPITPTSDISSKTITPTSLLPVGRPKKVFYPIPKTNLELEAEFRVPNLPCKKVQSPRNNFGHIVSPIGLYIKNSPKVPLIGNYTPVKTSVCKTPKVHQVDQNKQQKENIDSNTSLLLPATAYKSSAYTALSTAKQSPTIPASINKYNKANKLIATPEQHVISHEKRIKHTKLPRLISSTNNKTQDSFADLSVSSAEVSVCVKKTPVRTATVLGKKL